MFGPYHRLSDSAEVIRRIQDTGELWGKAPRNFFHSDIAKVKAFDGPLPDSESGFEFETKIEPDPGQVPGRPTWSVVPDRPGIAFDGTYAKIKVRVLKYR